jgi:hypothetical protein
MLYTNIYVKISQNFGKIYDFRAESMLYKTVMRRTRKSKYSRLNIHCW